MSVKEKRLVESVIFSASSPVSINEIKEVTGLTSNKIKKTLEELNDLFIQNKAYDQINKINIDCKEKNLEDMIFSLLSELGTLSNLNFDYKMLLNSKISHLWNLIKLTSRKIDYPLFITFNNIEYLEPEIFQKFLQYGKEVNFTLISTINKVLRPKTIEIFSEFDFKNKLDFFTYQELYSILKQRVFLSFSHEIDRELIKYMTDLICEQYAPVPGKGIEILREIYPLLKNIARIRNFELLNICQQELDIFQISDEFSMLNYISEEDILTVLFMDNLSNHFNNTGNYYISLEHLHELFEISCETLEYTKNPNEFNKLITSLKNLGIIKPSRRNNQREYAFNQFKNLTGDLYFMLINPRQLKVIIDAIFNQQQIY